ncbi:MAG TPA: zinc-dependent metalloprotease [Leptolyngbyaceae cyanobacterium M65_K2018_010]|nr:zinc-dependent metalloprotease [Leptolyngbyaceae cyanobacterium M65_K2018_010]
MRPGVRLGLIALCSLIITLGPPTWQSGLLRPATAQVPGLDRGVLAQVMTDSVPPVVSPPVSPEAGEPKPFTEVTQNLVATPGLFTLYRDPQRQKALLGLRPDQLNQNLLLIATLESGVGEAGLFRGWPINDLMIQFRRAPDHRLQVVVPNLYFRTDRGHPQNRQRVPDSFSDSVLFTVPILAIKAETGEMVIDLGDFLLNRDPANLAGAFPWIMESYTLNPESSYLGTTQVFPENLELETVLGFSGSGTQLAWWGGLGSLPDGRGFNLRVRYSLSALPHHPAFQPRLADQRVGYFITAYRTPTQARSPDPFVRYIQRWHLEKQDPTAALSPPRQPIVFWLENTIPPPYRQAIREGVEWWNGAFERAGFTQAIEVRQMPDRADWDPADVRYNVIRWSDSFEPWALGLGPARVNPLTGEILDADVILDASVIGYLNQEYQTLGANLDTLSQVPILQFCGHSLAQRLFQRFTGNPSPSAPPGWAGQREVQATPGAYRPGIETCAGVQAFQQGAFGALALNTLADPLTTPATRETYVQDYLRALTAHEVGHVLGLRHNFLGSTLLATEALNDPEITRSQGMVSSVMDYFPPNLAPPGQTQGDYFPTRLGPYDLWAIEYGYKPITSPVAAQRELQHIASRAGAPELALATDEDIYDFLDPKASPWDLSRDPLGYAAGQMAIAQAIWDKLNWFSLNPGETYGALRRRVDLVFSHYWQQAMIVSNYIGGQRFNRTDPWSSQGQPPFQPIAGAEQRRALDILNQRVLATDALQLPPELINLLAPDRWLHWGQPLTLYPLDYPIYDRVLFVQALVLSDILYGERLVRLRDAELKAPTADPLTLTELFETLGQSVWGEILNPGSEPIQLSSLRRGLQRHHLNILTHLFLRHSSQDTAPLDWFDGLALETTWGAPEDARLLARHQMRQLQGAVETYLRRFGRRLDTTTLAYLEDVDDRITQVLNASLRRQ